MKTHLSPIPLSNPSEEGKVVKTCALFTFRALRTVADYVSQLPAVATQAANDVREAWEESSRPNA
ncbi:MAG: hypothetical protein KJ787_04050 [Gammaproteobacteria bacterium]|nr:hypothetical protein [Gammaproteobacteria bacterium]MBU1645483.1 hypothetical protein [Gammaproteobacteria bacterium]MBU1971106.1 hypothetical protein [Gammaproteobacteria bacterium]